MLFSIQSKNFFPVLVAVFSLVSAREIVDISRCGRRIQLDGFLIDWKEKNRRTWSGSDNWYWDALNTPEGVAGYFCNEAVRCSSWTFHADARRPCAMKVPDTDTGKTKNSFFCANLTSGFTLTVEWVIPWDSMAVDSGGTYAIHVTGNSTCGDTLQPLLITGSSDSLKDRGGLMSRFAEWSILIAALAAVVMVVRLKIRKKYCQSRRRESLRR
jgi:hypothetical protein